MIFYKIIWKTSIKRQKMRVSQYKNNKMLYNIKIKRNKHTGFKKIVLETKR
jgi:hypothetical protein